MRKLTCSAYVTGWLRDVVLTSAFVVVTAAAHQAFAQIDTVTVQGRQHREIIELQGASVHGFQGRRNLSGRSLFPTAIIVKMCHIHMNGAWTIIQFKAVKSGSTAGDDHGERE